MPKTHIFHLHNNPSVEFPIELMDISDWTPNIGKSFYVAHDLYMKNGKPALVTIDSVYPDEGVDCMPIAVCHRIDDGGVQEKIEVGCELLFATEKEALEENDYLNKYLKH